MFRKYDNSENAGFSSDDSRSMPSVSSSDKSDPFDSFDALGDDDLMDIEFSDQLSYKSDTNWNDMMDSYDELSPDNGTSDTTPKADNCSFSDSHDTDPNSSRFADDFDSGFGDDFDSDLGNGSGGDLGKNSGSGFGDDFGGGFDAKRSSAEISDDYRYDDTEEEQKAFIDTALFTRIIVALVAVILGIGVLLIVKLKSNQSDIYTQPYVSDSILTDSHTVDVSSEEPQAASATEQEESEVSVEEKTVYTELSIGSSGYEVINLQNRLMELGYIGKDSCTGYYGEFTTKIVKRFQKKANLPQTGIADQATQEKLFAADAPRNVNE